MLADPLGQRKLGNMLPSSINSERQTATPASSHNPSMASTNISPNIPRGLWSVKELLYSLLQSLLQIKTERVK